MQVIKSGNHTFEVVENVPAGYKIWNIGEHMVDGYLPLCKLVGDGSYSVEADALKAIKMEGAQTVLAAIGGGQDTPEKMERYIRRYRNARPGTWAYRQVQRMEKALPILREVVFE